MSTYQPRHIEPRVQLGLRVKPEVRQSLRKAATVNAVAIVDLLTVLVEEYFVDPVLQESVGLKARQRRNSTGS